MQRTSGVSAGATLVRVTVIALMLRVASIDPYAAGLDDFPTGYLIATTADAVWLMHPTTGYHEAIVTTQTGLGDIAYNPVTHSAFICSAAPFGSNEILEVTWSDTAGYRIAPFISNRNAPKGICVNRAGHLFWGQKGEGTDNIQQRIWRANPAGVIMPVTAYDIHFLWTPIHLTFSPDESHLYVSVVPQNQIDVVTFPERTLAHLAEDIDFPGGIDVADNGTIFAAENVNDGDNRIVTVGVGGLLTTWRQEAWMNVGSMGDLLYDDREGTMYVCQRNQLYRIPRGGQGHKILETLRTLAGLDLILAVPPPPTTTGPDWAVYP